MRLLLGLLLGLGALSPRGAFASSPWLIDGCGRGGVCGGSPTATFTVTPSVTPSQTPYMTVTGTPPTQTQSPTFSPTPSATRTPVGGNLNLRVDVGATVGHSDGQIPDWVPDQAFSPGGYGYTVPGHVYNSTTDPLGGTSDPGLYRSFREDQALEYRFSVPAGSYEVDLHFCDFASTAPGQRVFSVISQATVRASNLDLFTVAGRARAYKLSFDAVVTDGTLLIQFPYTVGSAPLAAIEIHGLQQLNPLLIDLHSPFNAVLLP